MAATIKNTSLRLTGAIVTSQGGRCWCARPPPLAPRIRGNNDHVVVVFAQRISIRSELCQLTRCLTHLTWIRLTDTLIRGSATESLPRKKTNCAMLLHYEASGDVYALVSAFELNGNHVYLIDSTTPKQLLNEFGGNADAFLQLLRSMVSK